MTLTAELSLYPLQESYITVIQSFIDDLHTRDGLNIVTNAMSTQIRGDHDQVMAAVSAVLRRSAQRFGDQVLVCKFIPMALEITPP